MYNPSAKEQSFFQSVVTDILSLESGNTLFAEEEFLSMKLVFRLRRPKSHFIACRPSPEGGRLKKSAPKTLTAGRVDVDNLAKFVLDSLNGVLYADDRQVVSLTCTKIYDFEGSCEGATEIFIKSVDDEEMDAILQGAEELP